MWLCCRLVLAPTAKSDATNRVLMKSYKQICQRPLVCAVFLLPRCLVFFFASRSEGRAKAEWRHTVKTNPRLATSRPFSNAKIARINDIANFFEQKMSLFPLLKKRGSLWWQKRLSMADGECENCATKKCFLAYEFGINPNRSLGRHFNLFHFFRSVYGISAFLPASCPHPCLAVARYDFASDATNMLGTNTNLP